MIEIAASKGQIITALVAIAVGIIVVLGSIAYVATTYSAAAQHTHSSNALSK